VQRGKQGQHYQALLNTVQLHANWIGKLIDELLKKAQPRTAVVPQVIAKPELRFSGDPPHFPFKVASENDRSSCYKQTKKRIKPMYKCNQCKVALCLDKDCFEGYHTVIDY
jgi:hypothetical protein